MSIQKIKINCKDIAIAELEFGTDEYGNHYHISSENVENKHIEYEQTDAQGFIEILEVDIKKTPSQLLFDDIQYVHKEVGYIEGFFDADEYGREKGIAESLGNFFRVADKYNFKYEYNQEEWDKQDNTCDDIDFSESDFYEINITDENHPKASLIADDFATDLIIFLKSKLMEML